MKKWLVAYVRLHHEKKTAERLTAMNIENFLPVQEEIRQWTYRKKKIERVVIPMMIFVQIISQRIISVHFQILFSKKIYACCNFRAFSRMASMALLGSACRNK